jgi:hypothetical protein
MGEVKISDGFVKSHLAGWLCAELTTAGHHPDMD